MIENDPSPSPRSKSPRWIIDNASLLGRPKERVSYLTIRDRVTERIGTDPLLNINEIDKAQEIHTKTRITNPLLNINEIELKVQEIHTNDTGPGLEGLLVPFTSPSFSPRRGRSPIGSPRNDRSPVLSPRHSEKSPTREGMPTLKEKSHKESTIPLPTGVKKKSVSPPESVSPRHELSRSAGLSPGTVRSVSSGSSGRNKGPDRKTNDRCFSEVKNPETKDLPFLDLPYIDEGHSKQEKKRERIHKSRSPRLRSMKKRRDTFDTLEELSETPNTEKKNVPEQQSGGPVPQLLRTRTILIYADAPDEATANHYTLGEASKVGKIMYSYRETEMIEEMLRLFVTNAPRVILFLMENVEKSGQPSLARSLINLAFGVNVTTKLMEYLLEDEFKKNLSVGKDILRENGIFFYFLKPYLHIVGSGYLELILGSYIRDICREKNVTLEIDPSKADPYELPKNKERLIQKIQLLLDILTNPKMIAAMPAGIRTLCKQTHQLASQYTPGKENIYVGSLLLLRYINPVIFSPELYGLTTKNKPPTNVSRRNLILITKVLQNISNNISSSKKEQFMGTLFEDPTGGPVVDYKMWSDLLYGGFQEIVNVKYNPLSVHGDVTPSVTVYDLHSLHSLVWKLKPQILQLYISSETCTDPEGTELTQLLDRLGSFQNKENFSALDDQHRKLIKNMLEARNDSASYVGYVYVTNKRKYLRGSHSYTGNAVDSNINGTTGSPEHTKQQVTRILIVGTYRIMMVTRKGKLTLDRHQLDLIEIVSKHPNHLQLVFSGDSQTEFINTVDTMQIILCIKHAFDYAFPSMPIEKRFIICADPNSPIHLHESWTTSNLNHSIVPTYQSLCDYYRVPESDLVASLCWDLQHMYTNINSLDFKKFTEHYQKPITDIEAAPLLHAIGYTRKFKQLIINNFKFQESSFKGLIEMIRNNESLTSLTLSNIVGTNLRREFSDLFLAMKRSEKFPVTILNLAYTELDKPSASALGQFLAVAELVSLDLTGCLKAASLKVVLDSLLLSRTKGTLNSLRLGRTKFGEKESQDLRQILASCVNLTELKIPDTGISLPTLLQGGFCSCHQLLKLDISKNKFPRVDQWKGLAGLLSNPDMSLYEIDISATSVPLIVLEEILLITEGNIAILASNNNLGEEGGIAIGRIAPKITCVDKLDISENCFTDGGLASILEGLCSNTSITELNISGNFQLTNDKNRAKLVRNLEFLASSGNLEVFHMQGGNSGKLRESIAGFLYSLKDNTCLRELDVTGHAFGDKGAICLGRVLHHNQALETIYYDDNGITTIGLLNISEGIANNLTIKRMPLPFLDLRIIMESPHDRLQLFGLLAKIENDLSKK